MSINFSGFAYFAWKIPRMLIETDLHVRVAALEAKQKMVHMDEDSQFVGSVEGQEVESMLAPRTSASSPCVLSSSNPWILRNLRRSEGSCRNTRPIHWSNNGHRRHRRHRLRKWPVQVQSLQNTIVSYNLLLIWWCLLELDTWDAWEQHKQWHWFSSQYSCKLFFLALRWSIF